MSNIPTFVEMQDFVDNFTATKNTVYHRLQYLLPGESVKMADTTGSGVSQTFFSNALNECLPSKQKKIVFKCV